MSILAMPSKRKEFETDGVPSRKKPRKGDEDDYEDAEDDYVFSSDDSGDYAVNYTENGTKRANSEARRAWSYVCEIPGCGQRFNRPCRLEAHMRSHNKERPFVCPHQGCDKDFPRKDHLQRHLKNGHAEPDRDFLCDWPGCGKTFTSNGRLQRHKDVHESKFYCTGYPPCNEVFRKQKTLDAHIKSQHLETKPFPCTYVDPESGEHCTHGYQTESSLRKHIIKAHEKVEDVHFCMVCIPPGTEFDTIQNEGEAIQIPKQPLSFATREDLTAHSNEFHKPICTFCGSVFKDQAYLKSHVQTVHTDPANQPQFHCPRDGCKSVFNRKHNLNVHIQTVHDQQCKYRCTAEAMQTSKHPDLKAWDGQNACGAPFKAKSSLDQHIRTHHLGLQNRKATRKMAKPRKKKPEPSVLTTLTGVGYDEGRDKPCLLPPCEYRFYRNQDLRRHLRSQIHQLPDAQIDELILEREAMAGGQFWIGGLDPALNDADLLSYADSADPSVPQTPLPHFSGDHLNNMGYGAKPHDPNFGLFDPQMEIMPVFQDVDGDDDDVGAEMDKMMGLSNLPPAVEAADGLQWDMQMLTPVRQYNYQG
ncbi:hypothetical protein DM02DRAFT_570495 [Periconia macrospinosa]|uniref:C2H2-type domain-containing protein n=1 Tax=Periconia macrospinosa TaxID=97972 RepID=A0A2V1DCX2_9PLEO|nr:hypothetical protein DM02DRAFT_570495 [Periconia macrospinosa]